MKRCSIYARVSTDSQTTDNQLIELQKIAKLKGYVVTQIFTDEGISGSKGRDFRTGFDNIIIGAIKKDFDIILCWSVDRLGRSLQDLVSFLNEIHSVGCDLYIHQSGIETQTPSGKMMFSMIGVFAEFERDILAERVKAGQERAKEQGKKIGRPTNLNQGLVEAIKYMRNEQQRGIRAIAKELKVGVGTIYRVLEVA